MESKNFDFTAIIKIVRENIKLFLVVGIVSAVLAVIFSGEAFLKPKFKSIGVVYPVNIQTYSDESETEQLLQIFQSSSIRDTIIEKYNLYKRYDIDQDAAQAKHFMYQEYGDRITASKTEFESVKLEVMDEDPDTAKAIADEVLHQVNEKIRYFRKKRGLGLSESYRRSMDVQLAIIDSIEARISEASKEGRVLQYEAQTRELLRSYFEELSNDKNSDEVKEIEKWMSDLNESGSLVRSLQTVSYNAAAQYGVIGAKFLDWKAMALESDASYIDIVISPDSVNKKAWPIRWVILVTTVMVALISTLILLALAKVVKSH